MLENIASTVASSFERAPWGWGLLATVLLALIKAWPALAQQAQVARAALRKEHRDDLHDCQQRLDAMQVEVRALAASVNNLKIDLNGTISAYRILDAEVERDNPTSLGLAQARAIMSTAFNVAPSTTPTAHVPERRNNGERE